MSLLFGSNSSIFSNRFNADPGIFCPYFSRMRLFFDFSILTSPVRSLTKSCRPVSSGVGVPSKSNIFCNTPNSVSAEKRGFPKSSSAKIHPQDHISTAHPYRVAPNRISGGRYHRVMTLLVNSCENPRLEERPARGVCVAQEDV